ncbi:hypothetical protein [Streptomyces sp. GbtcB7]|nr:hypothetical protein [Streptomyces sp. GbtcB7]
MSTTPDASGVVLHERRDSVLTTAITAPTSVPRRRSYCSRASR